MDHRRGEVDTSRPFLSVKEAVALFGERIILAGGVRGATDEPLPTPGLLLNLPSCPPPFSLPPRVENVAAIKRLEEELEETKKEVMVLKERGTEMETMVASLDAEIHRRKPRMGEVEVEVSEEGGGRDRVRCLPTLAHMLSLEEEESRRMEKKKPVIPLVGDVFSSIKKKKKKRRSTGSFEHPSSICL